MIRPKCSSDTAVVVIEMDGYSRCTLNTVGPARRVAVLRVLLEQTREQVLASKEGRMDFNTQGIRPRRTALRKGWCTAGLHQPMQRFDIGGTGGGHTQSCLLCGAIGLRNGKRKRTECDGGVVCLSKARKARNALRRCFKIICLLNWWTKATYSPPSSGGAGYRRLQQEAMTSAD